jgi:cytochrome c nitrite reductase small subunit
VARGDAARRPGDRHLLRARHRAAVSRTGVGVLLACLLGIPAGIGAFTFVYAKGFSYLSTDPRACVNCHIMNPQFDAWSKSGHRHTATCVGCHLPHSGLSKWTTKAEQGFRHSVAFTLQNFKEPIAITPRDREIVRVNCVRCHESLVHAVVGAPGPARGTLDCLHCHAGAGHGAGG